MRGTFTAALGLLTLLGLAACDNSHETLGQKLDNAGTQARDAVDPPRGPAEKAGRSIDRTLDSQ